MTRKWYAVIVQTHMDIRFARDLGERGHEIHVQWTFSREKHGSRSFVEPRLLLSPYVWVCVDDAMVKDGLRQSFDAVKQTYGYLDVVSLRLGDRDECHASEIPEAVVRGLRRAQIEDYEIATRRVRRKESIWHEGDLIQVIGDGHPFMGYEGVVSQPRSSGAIVEIGPQKLPLRLDDDDMMLVKPFARPKLAMAS